MFALILKNHENRLEIDTDQPGVSTFAHDEKIVLVIDEEVSESVADITFDALIAAGTVGSWQWKFEEPCHAQGVR